MRRGARWLGGRDRVPCVQPYRPAAAAGLSHQTLPPPHPQPPTAILARTAGSGDFPPQYRVVVAEDAEIGTALTDPRLGNLSSSDNDLGPAGATGAVTYSIVAGNDEGLFGIINSPNSPVRPRPSNRPT